MSTIVIWSFFSGAIAACSLTLGSSSWSFIQNSLSHHWLTCAFGAGALLSALALELIAPTVEHLVAANTLIEIEESTQASSY